MEAIIGVSMIVLSVGLAIVISYLVENHVKSYQDALRNQIDKDLK
jgi:hypothetical protein